MAIPGRNYQKKSIQSCNLPSTRATIVCNAQTLTNSKVVHSQPVLIKYTIHILPVTHDRLCFKGNSHTLMSMVTQWLREVSQDHEINFTWSGRYVFESLLGRTWGAQYCLSRTWKKYQTREVPHHILQQWWHYDIYDIAHCLVHLIQL